ITPDHLDRYPSLEPYVAAKVKIFENQTPSDYALLNLDDERVAGFRAGLHAHVLGFSRTRPVRAGAYLDGDRIVVKLERMEEAYKRSEIRLPGVHNLANAMAALTLAHVCGCPPETLRRVLRSFPGLEHALELAREHRGVRFIN